MNATWRRGALWILLWLAFGCSSCGVDEKAPFSFGVIADCQYADEDSPGRRESRLSKVKLAGCVEKFNSMDLEFVIQLGDLINRRFRSFDDVLPIYNRLRHPRYHVLGNHDVNLEEEHKGKAEARFGMSAPYYAFTVGTWRFLVLDGNEISVIRYPKESEETRTSEAYLRALPVGTSKWYGAIGKKQRA